MSTSRQRALLELSAKFDDERKVREIEILKRDNAIQNAELRTRRLRELRSATVTALMVALCALLVWASSYVRKINARLLHHSEHDVLTGAHNRRYLRENVLAKQGARHFRGCVLLIDIDHFKHINDDFGHAAGDMVLVRIAARLSASLREGDTLVRWGGEEFLMILPSMSEAQLSAIARKLLDAVRNESLAWRGDSIHCTISIGYGSFPQPGASLTVSLDRAICLADKALYHAKRSGRDCASSLTELEACSEQDLLSA
jgi:diguanylate cyclase (GGDEF)-like protein